MLSKNVEQVLNEQIGLEAYASFLYLAMASWCDQQGLEGCAAFMRRQTDEERVHMLKIFDYVIEMDGKAVTPSVQQPPLKFQSIQKMFQDVYEHEQRVTQAIYKIVDLCNNENDYATLNFLQWYVSEQREEEALMRKIIDKIKIIGEGPQHLYFIDKEVSKINNQAIIEEAAADHQP
ncbi:MAG: ferritin [Saprospiraceae bacterium]|nr:ferritin [Saprospiraceae bacterium]